MNDDLDATRPRIRTHPGRDGLQIVDPIQDAQFALLTPESVRPSACDTDRFYFPVDTGVTVVTDTVETPYALSLWIRDGEGDVVREITGEETVHVDGDRLNVELATTHVKVQLAFEGGVTVESTEERVRFHLGEAAVVAVGARSVHEEPAATVETTTDPRDVMRAVSMLGSALKTETCERSFPSLRGHPPLVERGDAFSAPDWLEEPAGDVRIEVPPDLSYIYPVATLAYYLGAAVEPGSTPRVVTDDWTYPLDGPAGFETTVARALKQVFLLDCVTRTEGYYRVDLAERRRVEDRVDLDFAALYDRPKAEQLQAYLGVPFEAVADAVPRWKLVADVRPDPEYVSALPFLADELAVVRCPGETSAASLSAEDVSDRVKSALRGQGGDQAPGLVRGGGSRTRSESSMAESTSKIVRPPDADSIEQAYLGAGIPVGANKMTADSYYRRLEYEPSTEPRIRVAVVCNDERMADENVVSDIYGARDWIEFDITFRERLSTDEMRELLASDLDFLHYIGHVDEAGIRCPDGHLDTRDLSAVNTSAFLLNACDSYEQGYGLVDNGAMAGIATVTDVVSEAATSVGRTVARLLNQGFSLSATIPIIKEYERIGHHYLGVGDVSASVVDNKSGTPYVVEVDRGNQDTVCLTLRGYPRLDSPMGSLFIPHISDHDQQHLNSGAMCSIEMTDGELREFLEGEQLPVVEDGTLQWSPDYIAEN